MFDITHPLISKHFIIIINDIIIENDYLSNSTFTILNSLIINAIHKTRLYYSILFKSKKILFHKKDIPKILFLWYNYCALSLLVVVWRVLI